MKYVKCFLLSFLFIQSNSTALVFDSVQTTTVDWIVTPTIAYTKTAFSRGAGDLEPALYLAGAQLTLPLNDPNAAEQFSNASPLTQSFALARLVLEDNERAQIYPLAGTSFGASPITHLTLLNDRYPVIAIDSTTGNPTTSLQMLNSPSAGGSFTPAVTLNDATPAPGAQVTTTIAGMTAGRFTFNDLTITTTKDYIFVAVPATATTFDDDTMAGTNRGIAVVQRLVNAQTLQNTLQVEHVDHLRTNNGTAQARQLDLTADEEQFAITDPNPPSGVQSIQRAILHENDASLCWDEDLNRLYVGLRGVTRDSNQNSGGIFGVGMGYVQENVGAEKEHEFFMTSVVAAPTKDMLYKDAGSGVTVNVIDRGIGFFFDGSTAQGTNPTGKTSVAANDGFAEVQIDVPFVKTMKTSTGKNYLITHSVIGVNPSQIGQFAINSSDLRAVLAFPLSPLSNDPAETGSITAVNEDGVPYKNPTDINNGKYYVVPRGLPTMSQFVGMPNTSFSSIKVGGDGPFNAGEVTDLFVAGDAVYVAYKGTGAQERGIFYSAALFDGDGFIRSWSPWTRVMGDAINVVGAGLDTDTGNFYMLTTADDMNGDTASIFNTGSITIWGKGEDQFMVKNPQNPLSPVLVPEIPLSTVLAELFPPSSGGVYQLFPFDARTPGLGNFTMLVAVGHNKVALIETSLPVAGQSVAAQFVLGVNVFVVGGDALNKIAPLIGAEIQRSDNISSEVNLFVCGCGGVASIPLTPNQNRLKDTWNATQVPVSFVSEGPVYALARSANHMIAGITDNGTIVWDFTTAAPTTIDTTPGSSLVTVTNNAASDAIFILGTDNGIKVDNGTLNDVVPGQIMQLQALSPGVVRFGTTDGLNQQPTLVYALTFAPRVAEEGERSHPLRGKKVLQVYRLAVYSNKAHAVPNALAAPDLVKVIDRTSDDKARPFLQLDDYRTNISVDGTILFNLSPRDGDRVDFVRLTQIPSGVEGSQEMLSDQNSISEEDLDLRDGVRHFHVGVIRRDFGSGSFVVPGDWGVRVND